MQKRNIQENTSPVAMAFYHEKGLPAAFEQAIRFAGEARRLATLPDVITARLSTAPGSTPWETYFTTMTAEFVGMSRGGNKIILVAHGIGPMTNMDGIFLAYGHEFKDKTRSRRGGRITQNQLLDLENGKYGEVHVVDFNEYTRRYEYPFLEHLRSSQAFTDPLLKARFGPRAEEYVALHTQKAREWHQEQVGNDPDNRYGLPHHEDFYDRRRSLHRRLARPDSNPFVVQIADASNCSYMHHPVEDGLAFAHLISIGRLMNMHHTEDEPGGRVAYESLVFEAGCHEWWNGVRLVGIRGAGPVTDLDPGANDLRQMLEKHWRKLMKPTRRTSKSGFFALMEFAGQFFTQYPKQGEVMDTHEPEFRVKSLKKIGTPVEFSTDDYGSPFFKFGVNEVRQLAPKDANAYHFVGDPERAQRGGKSVHICPVQFYRVEIDPTKRLLQQEAVRSDYDLMMSLME